MELAVGPCPVWAFRCKVVELASAVRQAGNNVPDLSAVRAKMIFTDYELRIIIVVRNA